MCAQLYVQRNAQPDTWVMSGAPTATTVFLSLDATINYSDGSSDTLPANTLAVLPDTTTVFDRSHDVYVPYTVQGSRVLSIIKESLLPTLGGDYAPLARVELHGIKPYQPEPYLAGGGLGTSLSTSTTVATSTAGQGKVYGPLGTEPTGWHDPGFDDSAWAASVANTLAGTPVTVGGAAWISYSNSFLSGGEVWLFRQTFGVASGVLTGGTLRIQADDFILGAWVNGTLVYAPGAGSFAETEADPAIPASALLPGATNLLAVEVQNYTGGGGNVSALAFRVDIGGVPTGGITSVGLSGPTGTTVSGSPVTGGSGTLSLAWAPQSANTVLAAPSGSSGAPTFRALVGADIPVDASTIVSSAGTIKGNYQAGSGVSISGNTISATGSGGSVTSVALSMPGIFSVSGSPVTSSGTLSVTLANQSAATVFAGPASGSAATPSFRALQGTDLPAAAGAGGHVHAHGHFL